MTVTGRPGANTLCCHLLLLLYHERGKKRLSQFLEEDSQKKTPKNRLLTVGPTTSIKTKLWCPRRDCTACPEGKYKDALGSAECTNCPAGEQQGCRRPRRSLGAGARGVRDGNARAEQGGAWAALFDDDAESDAYLGWQAPTQARQGLPSACPALAYTHATRVLLSTRA